MGKPKDIQKASMNLLQSSLNVMVCGQMVKYLNRRSKATAWNPCCFQSDTFLTPSPIGRSAPGVEKAWNSLVPSHHH